METNKQYCPYLPSNYVGNLSSCNKSLNNVNPFSIKGICYLKYKTCDEYQEYIILDSPKTEEVTERFRDFHGDNWREMIDNQKYESINNKQGKTKGTRKFKSNAEKKVDIVDLESVMCDYKKCKTYGERIRCYFDIYEFCDKYEN